MRKKGVSPIQPPRHAVHRPVSVAVLFVVVVVEDVEGGFSGGKGRMNRSFSKFRRFLKVELRADIRAVMCSS